MSKGTPRRYSESGKKYQKNPCRHSLSFFLNIFRKNVWRNYLAGIFGKITVDEFLNEALVKMLVKFIEKSLKMEFLEMDGWMDDERWMEDFLKEIRQEICEYTQFELPVYQHS